MRNYILWSADMLTMSRPSLSDYRSFFVRVDEKEESVEEDGAAARRVQHVSSVGRADVVVVHIQGIADVRIARILCRRHRKRKNGIKKRALKGNEYCATLPAIRWVESLSPLRLPSAHRK